ncbi:FAD-dependent monooxygenase [Shinella sp. PSBB067]|uniref:FAD-dependent monooxygenase n=1 Tax=Shinella sp. PSBB067 TaxID=2715959 RepID=UPI00193B3CEA|nr:FAD-dependent monooxygenase [Shinella sp. PSBB067]QRI65086.1 FAD-dependent monooxygenase [Shinella sp. PSBB067]
MSPIRTTTIVGAGIAGLTAALALARRGIASHILEQAPALEEVGAGLQLSPNASRILVDLGLLDALSTRWTEPDHIGLSSGISLSHLASVPAGKAARSRWGAPYGVLHRASLQTVLLDAVRAEPLCTLTTGTRIESAADALAAAPADVLVAADGVWSRLRHAVPGALPARYSGNVAWRFLVPFAAAPPFLDPRAVTAFLGPQAHLIAYPLTEIEAFNIVAIHAQSDAPPIGWLRRGDAVTRGRMLEAFAGWHADIRRLLPDAQDPLVWPLFGCPDGAWTDGRKTVLIGDAAHAMTPFAAQGAAMAIEDAALLAARLATATDIPEALRRFEKTRRERVARVRSRGAFNRFAYHARGPVALARNLVLSLRRPEGLAADLDWLYGYRTPE